ncbi:MAG TPA: ABC transporter ATP-binding protein [Acidobacteriota bacterium]|nr:ABC transporter ATP-binding protein [Acidobacteriota bacterium]HNH81554.1 ABC transporter ATP-binding protein [Acidobacteriota bacterium]
MASHHEEEAVEKSYDGRLFWRLLRYLKPYRVRISIAIPLITLTSIFELVALNLTMVAVDLYLKPPSDQNLSFFSRLFKNGVDGLGLHFTPANGVLVIGIWYVILISIVFSLTYVQSVILNSMGQFIMYDMRKEIFAKFQHLALSYYDRHPIGRMISRLTSDVDALNELFTAGFVTLFSDVFTLIGILVFLLMINWKLAMVSMIIIPLLVGVTAWFRINATATYREVRTRMARINAFLQEHITGMPVVQLFNREARAMADFDEINDLHRIANVNSVFYYAVFYPAVGLISSVGVALVVWYGGGQVIQGALTLGSLIFFIQAMQRFYEPIQDISEKYNILQAAMAASERVFKVLDTPVEITSPDTPKAVPNLRGEIEFRNVWFAYKGEDWVLKDVSFKAPAGQSIALVGATGSGKTTITSLLMRFYDIQRGQILLDGVDIKELDLHQLRQSFGIVLQDVFLFAGTIADNIRLGNTSIDDDRIRFAAREVHADEFIHKLPGGYQAEVKERGATLSVGQKQLLSFARALAFDPRILILDEATSSIDTHTEQLIQQAIERLLVDRTSILVAHRLSTIQKANQIIVLHKGEIREMGTHQELLAQHGLYRRLYELQYKEQSQASTGDSVPTGSSDVQLTAEPG